MKYFVTLFVAALFITAPAFSQSNFSVAKHFRRHTSANAENDRLHPQVSVSDSLRAAIAGYLSRLPRNRERPASEAAKTTRNPARLVGYYVALYDSGAVALVPQDSARFAWSGGRGADPTIDEEWYDTEDYDTLHSLSFASGAFLPDIREEQTFNSAGNRLTKLVLEYRPASGLWAAQYDQQFSYDATGKLLMKDLRRTWDESTSTFVNLRLDSFAHDDSGRVISATYMTWDTTTKAWEGDARNFYTYDTADRMLSATLQYWNTITRVWYNYGRQLLSYDTAGNNLIDQGEYWNTAAGVWRPYTRHVYTYNSARNMLSHDRFDWVTSSSAWLPSSRSLYTYSGGYLSEDITQLYEASSRTWTNSGRRLYTNDAAGRILSTLSEVWNGTAAAWTPATRWTYTFNASGFGTEDVRQYWNAATSAWDNNSRYVRVYNAAEQLVEVYWMQWNNTLSSWGGRDEDDYVRYTYESYTPILSAPGAAATAGSLRLYPVPAANELHVDVKWTEAQAATVSLADAMGRVVGQWRTVAGARSTLSIPVSTLSNGTYFLNIAGEKCRLTQVVQVLH